MEADDEYRTNPSLPRLLGCNRPDHTRADCHHKNHPDFNHSGQWDGCKADKELKTRGKTGAEIKLTRGYRSDTTSSIRRVHSTFSITTIDAIEMVDVEDVEVERVGAMSTSLETQVRPVSLVASLP